VSIGSGANLDGIYTYDNEGKMATVAYPNSGPTFTNSFDNMSRPTGMTQGSSSIVSGVSYGPANELLGITSYGAVETRGYNNLLQMTSIAFTGTSSVNMQYSYPAGSNNGKIGSQTDVVSGEVVQYTYDSLNRLSKAETTSSAWGQGFVYDPFGNLNQINVTKGSAPTLSVAIDQTTNRLMGSLYNYDPNGNMLTDGSRDAYSYDVENRMLTAAGVGVPDVVYAYSPSNQRVWKGTYTNSGGNWTQTAQEVYFYGVDGKKLGTYQMAPNPPSGVTITPTELRAYFGSKPVGYAMGTNAQSAVFTPYAMDRLGSNRGVGKFYPYGQDEGTPAPNDEVKYATYTRDSATGLDYAMNRYYSNSLGRFMTPDSGIGAHLQDAQSWNRYSYAAGDPANRIDPSGRDFCDPDDPTCISLDIPDFSSFCPIPNPPGYSGSALVSLCYFSPVALAIQQAVLKTFSPKPDCNLLASAIGLSGFTYGEAQQIWKAGNLANYSDDFTAATIGSLAAVTWQGESSFGLSPKNNGNSNGTVDIGPFQINTIHLQDSGVPAGAFGTNLKAGQVFNGNPDANISFGITLLEGLYSRFGVDAAGRYVGSLLTNGNAQLREATFSAYSFQLELFFTNPDCFPHK